MTEQLDRDAVLKVARLARLKLSDEERDRFTTQLADVLRYVALLNEVETDGVEPMAHALERTNVFRADQPCESLPREKLLANAPKTDGKYFAVPQILEET